eukprot:CAMPEP_0170644742 /NCGR_PEP_ID=MMETSP0224-20130122/42659_1 /TAXON_ID=285029 /ORGANISM="Togula jolla, Strain CCCM 725" /LENGTH=37 /DNA_ID= /DNA_START= /DNA_END= /DNA_ORIENTATION=
MLVILYTSGGSDECIAAEESATSSDAFSKVALLQKWE